MTKEKYTVALWRPTEWLHGEDCKPTGYGAYWALVEADGIDKAIVKAVKEVREADNYYKDSPKLEISDIQLLGVLKGYCTVLAFDFTSGYQISDLVRKKLLKG